MAHYDAYVLGISVFLLTLGSVARITRFLNTDVLAAPIRSKVIAWRGPDSKAAELIECPWCLSIWVASAAVPTAYLAGHTLWFQIPAAVLTISYVYAMTAQHLDH